jgi:predicted amidohydrolase YtcJ
MTLVGVGAVPSESQMDSAAARADPRRGRAWGDRRGVRHGRLAIAALRRAKAAGTLTLRVSAYPAISDWRNAAESLRINGPGVPCSGRGSQGHGGRSLGSTTAWFFSRTDARHTTGLRCQHRLAAHLDRTVRFRRIAGGGPRHRRPRQRLAARCLRQRGQAHGARDRRFKSSTRNTCREDIPRFAALGVQPSMVPHHAIDDGRWAVKRLD